MISRRTPRLQTDWSWRQRPRHGHGSDGWRIAARWAACAGLWSAGLGAAAVDDVCDGFGSLDYSSGVGEGERVLQGDAQGQQVGYALAALGDVNGDGYDDLAVGAPGLADQGPQAGAVYLFFGPVEPLGALSRHDADVVLVGPGPYMSVGWTVAAAGDVDGDGLHDVLVGSSPSHRAAGHEASAWLVRGRHDLPNELDLGDLGPLDGTSFTTPADDAAFGSVVAGVGDVDGDGLADVAIGAPRDASGGHLAGAVYVFTQISTGVLPRVSATSVLRGDVAGGRAGAALAGVGDVDGDGRADIVVGAPRDATAGRAAGAAYVVSGAAMSGLVPLSSAEAVVVGGPYDRLGVSVAAAGDVDGDGARDFWLGAKQYGSLRRGAAYLIRGGAHLAGHTVAADTFYSRLLGLGAGDLFGSAIAGDVDFNGDGALDVLVGAPHADGGTLQSGAAWVTHGPFYEGMDTRMTYELGMVGGAETRGSTGAAVGAADLNGDGFADALVAGWEAEFQGLGAAGRVSAHFGGGDVRDLQSWHLDGDGDGYGDPLDLALACEPLAGRVRDASDCDDGDVSVHPGASELDCADPVDRNCDGVVGPIDLDGDGVLACGGDCDDQDSAVYAGAVERCDGRDNNCVDGVDDPSAVDALRWFEDADDDGFGQAGQAVLSCEAPSSLARAVLVSGDCDDADAAVSPGASEQCDGMDNDCDGTVDGAGASDAVQVFQDADGDGFGDRNAAVMACAASGSYVLNSLDCDDTSAATAPGQTEVCDGVDNDCDGLRYLGGPVLSDRADVVVTAGIRSGAFGDRVAFVPDTNGDGRMELAVSAPEDGSLARSAGAVFIRYGDGRIGTEDHVSLEDGDDPWDARIVTRRSRSLLGRSLVAGDFNGDGRGDVAVGAPGMARPSLNQGAVFVFFGPLEGTLDVESAHVILSGSEGGDALGTGLAVGDVDLDGIDDLLVGAPSASGGGDERGEIYLVYGGTTWQSGRLAGLADASWSGMADGDQLGDQVAIVGDVNGDGWIDLGAGSPERGDVHAGGLWLSWGQDGGPRGDLVTDVLFEGARVNARLGMALAGVGDVNGDGLDDVLVSTSGNDAYLLLGGDFDGTEWHVEQAAALHLDGSGGFGQRLAAAGDVNGDGLQDMLISAESDDQLGRNAGAAYLVYGATSYPTDVLSSQIESVARNALSLELQDLEPREGRELPTVRFEDLVGVEGAKLLGAEEGSKFGAGLAGGADFNGDGFDDVLIGAPGGAAVTSSASIYFAGPFGLDAPGQHLRRHAYPLTVDGDASEWLESQRVATSREEMHQVFGWDRDRLYLGMAAEDVRAGGPAHHWVVYLGAAGTAGTTAGIDVAGQIPTLPFLADHALVWSPGGGEPMWLRFDGGSWVDQATWLEDGRGEFALNSSTGVLEVALSRASWAETAAMDVVSMWQLGSGDSGITYGVSPQDAAEDSTHDPDLLTWHRLSLSERVAPSHSLRGPALVPDDDALTSSMSTWYWDRDVDGQGVTPPEVFEACATHVPVRFPSTEAPTFDDRTRRMAILDASLATDCDDADPDRYVGAIEFEGDGVDSDCDGYDGFDVQAIVRVTMPDHVRARGVLHTTVRVLDPDAGTDLERPIELRYRWAVNGVVLPETGPSLDATGQLLLGDRVSVTVVAFDGVQISEPSTAEADVINTLPATTRCEITPAQQTRNDVPLVAYGEGTDEDVLDVVSISYDWFGAPTVHHFDHTDTVPPPWAGDDRLIFVACRPHDGRRRGLHQFSAPVYVYGEQGPRVRGTIGTDGNRVPEILHAEIGPAEYDRDDLYVVAVAWDWDQQPTTLEYRWFVNGQELAGQTSRRLPREAFHEDDVVEADVRAFDGIDYSPWFRTRARFDYPDGGAWLGSLTLQPEQPHSGQDIAGHVTFLRAVPTVVYEWSIDGEVVPDVTGPTLPSSYTAHGDLVTLAVTPFDGQSAGTTLAASVTVDDGMVTPVIESVSLSPFAPMTFEDVVATVEASDPNGDPLTLLYSWTVDGVPQAETSARLSADATNPRSDVVVVVTATDGTYSSEPATAAVAVQDDNQPPQVDQVVLSPVSPLTDDDLIAMVEATDPDGDPVVLAYRWTVDGVVLGGVTTQTLPAAYTRSGVEVEVQVTPTDGLAFGAPSSAAVTLGNRPPSVTLSLGPVPAFLTDDIVATAVGHDADGDEVTLTYTWVLDGRIIEGEESPVLSAAYTVVDSDVAVFVTPFDGHESGEVEAVGLTVANRLPAATLSLAPTRPRSGDDVVATAAATDLDGDEVTLAFAWQVDGVEVPAVTGATLPAENLLPGARVTATVTPSDALGTGAGTSATVTVNRPPTLEGLVLTPASPGAHQDLVASMTALDADGDEVTLTYTWQVNGVVVDGATGPTLSAEHTARGDTVRVRVTSHDGLEPGEVAQVTTIIGNTPAVIDALVILEQAPTRTDPLTTRLVVSDPDGDSYAVAYSWSVDGSVVAAATADHFPAGFASKGQVVSVTAVVSDDGVTPSAPATDSVVIVNTAPVVTTAAVSPAAPRTADELSCHLTSEDADLDTVAHHVTWTVNGVLVPEASSNTLPAAFTRKGDEVSCEGVPDDGETLGAPMGATIWVGNTPPVISSMSLASSSYLPDDDVVAEAVSFDADDDLVSLTYTWWVDGIEVQSGASSLLDSAWTEAGSTVMVTAEASDGEASSSPVTATVVVGQGSVNASPVVSCTIQTDSPGATDALTGTMVASDADGDALSEAMSWWIDGVLVGSGPVLAAVHTSPGDEVTLLCEASDGTATSSEQATVQVSMPETPVWNETTNATFAICGSVLDEHGAPLAAASVGIHYDFQGNVIASVDTDGDGTFCVTDILLPGSDYPSPSRYWVVGTKAGYERAVVASGSTTFAPAPGGVFEMVLTLTAQPDVGVCFWDDLEADGGAAWTVVGHSRSVGKGVQFHALTYDQTAPMFNDAAGYCTEIAPDEVCEPGPGCVQCDGDADRGCLPGVAAIPAPYSGDTQLWFGNLAQGRADLSGGNFAGDGLTCRPEGTWVASDWGSNALTPAPGGGYYLPVGGDGGFSNISSWSSRNWVWGAVESPAVALPDVDDLTLQFRSWFEIESVDPQKPEHGGYDHVRVDVRPVGSSNTYYLGALNPEIDADGRPGESFSSGGQNKAPRWSLTQFDLSAWAGWSVHVRFVVYSKDGKYNAFRGAGFDDVMIFDTSGGCLGSL